MFCEFFTLSTLTVVNVSRNGRGALYKPLKLLTLKTRKMHLNRPSKVLHSHHLLTDMRYLHWQLTKTLENDDRIQRAEARQPLSRLAWVASRWQGTSCSSSFVSKVLGTNWKRANNFNSVVINSPCALTRSNL